MVEIVVVARWAIFAGILAFLGGVVVQLYVGRSARQSPLISLMSEGELRLMWWAVAVTRLGIVLMMGAAITLAAQHGWTRPGPIILGGLCLLLLLGANVYRADVRLHKIFHGGGCTPEHLERILRSSAKQDRRPRLVTEVIEDGTQVRLTVGRLGYHLRPKGCDAQRLAATLVTMYPQRITRVQVRDLSSSAPYLSVQTRD